jgi:DivIVA domain-containing protein
MDITPQVINEVEFHQKMRGYDPDEVDDFLERVAVAVGALQDRMREAADRVTQAERRVTELEQRMRDAPPGAVGSIPPSVEEEAETIRRTLVLAQRTADAAIKEAEENAQRTISTAQEQANDIYREAQEQARQLAMTAEAEARKSADETRQRLVAEIIALEESRDAIRSDHSTLEAHLDEQRTKLRTTIGDLERVLEDPTRLRATETPATSGATRPSFLDDELALAEAPVEDEPVSAAPFGGEEPLVNASTPADTDDDAVTSHPISGGVTFTAPEADDSFASPPAPAGASYVPTSDEDEAWARFVGDEGGPPTAPVRLDEADDDAYLAELRKAMLDDGPASELLDAGEDQRRTRFGRRR